MNYCKKCDSFFDGEGDICPACVEAMERSAEYTAKMGGKKVKIAKATPTPKKKKSKK